jgi:hypothetical protein
VPVVSEIRDSIVVSISACHADDPGSIPGRGVFFSPLFIQSHFKLSHNRQNITLTVQVIRPRGPMDKASVFGTEDCRFESYRGHIRHILVRTYQH